jgi:hypothetical protein
VSPFGVDPHPSPLPVRWERERFRVAPCHLATRLDVNTPSPVSGEGWGEGQHRRQLAVLSRLEHAFERIIEGSVASAFRLRVQPAEIGRRLERAMLEARVTSVGATLGPNAFEVRLNPEDAAPYADWEAALCREMEAWLAELAFTRGIVTVGPMLVRITVDPTAPRRSVRATARFDAGARRLDNPDGGDVARLRHIRLLPLSKNIAGTFSVGGLARVGRAADNDVVVPDPGVSRYHARLEPDRGTWTVVDLASTNGTWVNGERIARSSIGSGDELAFGDVRFTIAAG